MSLFKRGEKFFPSSNERKTKQKEEKKLVFTAHMK